MTAGNDGLTIETEASTVRPIGDIDAHTASHLERALDSIRADERAVVDLGRVNFMDSSGLRVLLQVATRLREGGGELCIGNVPPAIERLFDITGLTDHFPRANLS